jgi:hypothetical protein
MFLWWSSLKYCAKNLIACRTLVAMATERKKLKKSSFQKHKELELRYLV